MAKGLCPQCYYKKHYIENRECRIKQTKEWRAGNLERAKKHGRKSHLKSKYGLTPANYDRMLEEQGGVCALCRKGPDKRLFAVDHDHATGRIRGLLCRVCNMHLNRVDADPDILRRITEYIAG